VSFPRFRKKGRDDRFRLTGAIRVVGRAVQLPRLGRIRLKEEPQVQGRILSATVRREADRWYVSLSVETEIPDPAPVQGPAVGVDLGLTHFAILVHEDGEVIKIHAPKPIAKYLRQLRRQERQHSRKHKGSRNRKKSALRLAKLYRRIRNIRCDFLPCRTCRICSLVIGHGLHHQMSGLMSRPSGFFKSAVVPSANSTTPGLARLLRVGISALDPLAREVGKRLCQVNIIVLSLLRSIFTVPCSRLTSAPPAA
jgi:transposase